ncbi:uncharacterized protein UV8b_03448 [Ustilaginoidea virens]|uniref:Uncharacterized protein n=1 Tax=Ustilaginoidea virens TaxID=1159556 RepID=A0A8E5MH44_USTVR|nr:uncharacterized protein UV8b_03448 [Ustilaginoidea virens]QUC19207.1 hypothetical protein UV8b_03448 [Ustilaginoidea virens]
MGPSNGVAKRAIDSQPGSLGAETLGLVVVVRASSVGWGMRGAAQETSREAGEEGWKGGRMERTEKERRNEKHREVKQSAASGIGTGIGCRPTRFTCSVRPGFFWGIPAHGTLGVVDDGGQLRAIQFRFRLGRRRQNTPPARRGCSMPVDMQDARAACRHWPVQQLSWGSRTLGQRRTAATTRRATPRFCAAVRQHRPTTLPLGAGGGHLGWQPAGGHPASAPRAPLAAHHGGCRRKRDT